MLLRPSPLPGKDLNPPLPAVIKSYLVEEKKVSNLNPLDKIQRTWSLFYFIIRLNKKSTDPFAVYLNAFLNCLFKFAHGPVIQNK